MTLSAPATVPVDSTLLASVAYDAGESLLYLGFRDGASYLYFSVPESVHQGLLAADSKGAYFNRQIRNRFQYQRVRRPK
jgi:KTSC domain-containing protein